MSGRLPISALVASCDEADRLERALPTIAFCAEVIVIDLECGDATAAVARAHGARLIRHERVPIAEWARVTLAPEAAYEWLLFVDPDEELPTALGEEIERLLPTLAHDVAVVFAPIRHHFRGRPLRGTIWGGLGRRRLLVRRDGVTLTPTIWGGTTLRDGYRALELPLVTETAIAHYWADGYRDWARKHLRYLQLEPADRARRGEVTGVRAVAATPWRSFHESFVARQGFRDGLTGFALSALWALFRTAAEVALLRELSRGRGRDGRRE